MELVLAADTPLPPRGEEAAAVAVELDESRGDAEQPHLEVLVGNGRTDEYQDGV